MKVKADVICKFTIEYEDENETDIEIIKEEIEMSNLQDLIYDESDDSFQIIKVQYIEKI